MARSLWKSTMVISAMTMLSRILGLVRDVVLMNVFGAGGLMDAFLVAFKIPNFFRRITAEGAFSQAFIPVLTDYKTNRPHEEVQLLIARVAGSMTLILSVLTLIVMVAAPAVIYAFAAGFHGTPRFDLAVDLLRLTFPYLLLISLTAFAGSVLNSYGSFATAAFAPVLLNICMIAAAGLAVYSHPPIMALGWGVLIAGILQLIIQLPELWKKNLLIRPRIQFADEGVQRIYKLMLPALFGVSVVQINLLLNTFWASWMQTGSVSWMYTAERLTELPLGLIGVAIATVILPSLSAVHAAQDDQRFKHLLDWAAKIIVLVGIPASIAMFILARPMMLALFMRGQFDLHDANMSALALQAMAGNILAFMLIKIFAPGFYARQDTKTPVRIGLIAVGVNIVLSASLVWLFKLLQIEAQHTALSIASTVAALVNAGMLYQALHRQGIYRFGAHWRRLSGCFLIANGAMVLSLLAVLPFFPEQGHQLVRVLALIGMCILGAGVYGGVLLLTGFRPRELRHD